MSHYIKADLTSEQKKRLKMLYHRDNYHGFLAIGNNIFWITICIYLVIGISPLWIPGAVFVIASRQRALATILHEAAHKTLFRSDMLNHIMGRLFGGWPILQSFAAYRISHVQHHHPKIGHPHLDPDFAYMRACGVYDAHTKSGFIKRFIILPLLGSLIIPYVKYLVKDRLIAGIRQEHTRKESLLIILFHMLILLIAAYCGFLSYVIILWYVPLFFMHPILGWFIELSEHYPLMTADKGASFYSRNRYPGWVERMFIGMHGENYHLTHHLLPGIPYWNLRGATQILREDSAFRAWDDYWGGIFSSKTPGRTSLIQYICTAHPFRATVHPKFA